MLLFTIYYVLCTIYYLNATRIQMVQRHEDDLREDAAGLLDHDRIMYIYIYIYIVIHTYMLYMCYIYIYIYIYIYVYIVTCVYMCVYIYIYIIYHMYVYIYIYIYIHNVTLVAPRTVCVLAATTTFVPLMMAVAARGPALYYSMVST